MDLDGLLRRAFFFESNGSTNRDPVRVEETILVESRVVLETRQASDSIRDGVCQRARKT